LHLQIFLEYARGYLKIDSSKYSEKIAKLSYIDPKTTSKPSVHIAPSNHRTHSGSLNNVLMDEVLEDE
jgi:hypothetical protein